MSARLRKRLSPWQQSRLVYELSYRRQRLVLTSTAAQLRQTEQRVAAMQAELEESARAISCEQQRMGDADARRPVSMAQHRNAIIEQHRHRRKLLRLLQQQREALVQHRIAFENAQKKLHTIRMRLDDAENALKRLGEGYAEDAEVLDR